MAIKDLGKKMSDSFRDAADAVRSKAAQAEMPDLKKFGEKATEQVSLSTERQSCGAKPWASRSHSHLCPECCQGNLFLDGRGW